MKKLLLALIFFAITPTAYAANTYHFTCADYQTHGGTQSCTGQTVSFSAGEQYDTNATGGFTFDLLNSAVWYITVDRTTTGDTTIEVIFAGNNALSNGTPINHAGSIKDFPVEFQQFAPPMTGAFFQITSNTYTGDITNLCLSDSATGCDPATATTTPTDNFLEIFGTQATTTSKNIVIADIPSLDLALIFATFYGVFYLMIKFFKRK